MNYHTEVPRELNFGVGRSLSSTYRRAQDSLLSVDEAAPYRQQQSYDDKCSTYERG